MQREFKSRRMMAVAVTGLGVAAFFAFAGPLNPPGGAVGSTYKTLTEVEPRIAINSANTPGDATSIYRISQPGSYYLTGNLTGKSGRYGIYIDADNVTLDLNGFSLIGVAGSLSGIQGYEGIRNTTIRNGVACKWDHNGVYLGGGSYGDSNGFLIENITASDNTQVGISAGYFGDRGVILHCVAQGNGTNGIESWGGVVIDACTSTDNGSNGIVVQSEGTVKNCVSNQNGSNGIFAGNSVVTGCMVSRNADDGIVAASDCLITENQVISSGYGTANSGAGIHISGNDNRIEGNNCTDSDRGIEISAPGNIIVRNTCSGNGINWVIIAGNAVAPIVFAPTNANAISGNSYSGGLGSTDPSANFTY